MAIGKGNSKTKKGKKKAVNPFDKKEWYTVKAPIMFSNRTVGKAIVTKSQGIHLASESLKGSIFEVSLADLNKNETYAFRKIKLKAEDVQGDDVLCSFYGMDLTRDKGCSLIKKWQSLIEARVDVRTTDGYTLRMFCLGFTNRMNPAKKTCYAQTGKIKQIRKKMVEIMREHGSKSDLKDLVKEFILDSISKDIEKACTGIFPITDCYIRKVKILKAPKFDLVKLMELHDESKAEDVGAKHDRENPAVQEATTSGTGGRY